MEAKFGPPRKKKRHDWIEQDEIFQKNSGYTLFDDERNGEILEDMKVEQDDEKPKNTNQIGYDIELDWTIRGYQK